MDTTIITDLITTVGFPIAIASYVIIILNKTLQENTLILTKLVEKMENMESRLEEKGI